MLDSAIIGGIFLILGAAALFYGYAQLSVLLYFVADTMWVWLAWQHGNIYGVITIIVGMMLGIGVWIKMNKGIFVKNLKKELDNEM